MLLRAIKSSFLAALAALAIFVSMAAVLSAWMRWQASRSSGIGVVAGGSGPLLLAALLLFALFFWIFWRRSAS